MREESGQPDPGPAVSIIVPPRSASAEAEVVEKTNGRIESIIEPPIVYGKTSLALRIFKE